MLLSIIINLFCTNNLDNKWSWLGFPIWFWR